MTWSPSFERHLHADDDSFLADIEVTETADEAHAIELAGFFFETTDEEHLAVGLQLGIAIELGDGAAIEVLLRRLALKRGRGLFRRHTDPPSGR